jgi:cytoplasmic iron level regulating protein YaaA (DUF328/UPF0246 family)
MLMVISPAKDLDFQSPAPVTNHTLPDLIKDASELAEVCRKLTPADLSSLMHISDKLAGLNVARFASWHFPFDVEQAKQALFAFNGDVYQGLQAQTFSSTQVDYAQSHLRILSGLYGVLRPLDLMLAYRLEMGTTLANPRGTNLYQFWGERVTNALDLQLQQLNAPFLLNLASQEYFKVVKPALLSKPVVDVQFKDQKNGQYKVISFFAKKARGMMARYVIEQQINSIEGLQAFAVDGYQFAPEQSKEHSLVFTRAELV